MMAAHAVVEMPKLQFPQSLTERYRPRAVGEFAGLAKPKAVLSAFVQKPYPSAWLFLGPSGVGKTTMGLAIAQQIRAELQHIASRQCDLETVEATARRCHFMPLFNQGAMCLHLVLVDEADQMTQAAQLAFLSKLDATGFPPNTIFIFTANDTRLLEPRFLSRCRLLEFQTAGMQQDLPKLLAQVARREGHKTSSLDFDRMAQLASYNVRDALMRLEVEMMAGAQIELPKATDHDHKHDCPKCHTKWIHTEPQCDLRYRTPCHNCGGSKTVGQERADKAVATRKKNLEKQLRDARKGKPCRTRK